MAGFDLLTLIFSASSLSLALSVGFVLEQITMCVGKLSLVTAAAPPLNALQAALPT